MHAHARRDFVPVALAVALARSRRCAAVPDSFFTCTLFDALGEPGKLAGRFFQPLRRWRDCGQRRAVAELSQS